MKKLILLALLLIPTAAFADSFALATATFDWDHVGFAFNGSMFINHIQQNSISSFGLANGLLTATADAHGIDGGDTVYVHNGALIMSNYTMVGNAVAGNLFVTVPYTLTASCIDADYGDPSSAVATVRLMFFGGGNQKSETVSLNCRDGGIQTGMITLVLNFTNTVNPGLTVYATASADSVATVPEVSSLALLPIGLLGMAWIRRRASAS